MKKLVYAAAAIAITAALIGVGITSTGMQVKAAENCNFNGGGFSCQGFGGHVTFPSSGGVIQEGKNGGEDGGPGRTTCDSTGCVSNGQGMNNGNDNGIGNSLHSHSK